MKTRFIGDVHGKMDQYIFLTETAPGKSVQLGDFGAGFVDLPILSSDHRFIRGNHDDPEVCRKHPNWIPDGTVEDGTLYIGGAWSIDQEYRTEGISWWADEQLTYEELAECVDKVIKYKPRVIVTHDCPNLIAPQLFDLSMTGGVKVQTRTCQALQSIFECHEPEFWIFGHWHHDTVKRIGNTHFICLNELSYIDLEL